MKTAFVCFFPVIPTNMGSAEVIRSLFISWPGKKKTISNFTSREQKEIVFKKF